MSNIKYELFKNEVISPIGGGQKYLNILKRESCDYVAESLVDINGVLYSIMNQHPVDLNATIMVEYDSNQIKLKTIDEDARYFEILNSEGETVGKDLISEGMVIRLGGNCDPIEEYIIQKVEPISFTECIFHLNKKYRKVSDDSYQYFSTQFFYYEIYIFRPVKIFIPSHVVIDLTNSSINIPSLCVIGSDRGYQNSQGAELINNSKIYSRVLQGCSGRMTLKYGSDIVTIDESYIGSSDAGRFIYNDEHNTGIVNVRVGDYIFRKSGYASMIETYYRVVEVNGINTSKCTIIIDRIFWFTTQYVPPSDQGLWKTYENENFNGTTSSSASIYTINMMGYGAKLNGIRLIGSEFGRGNYSQICTGVHTKSKNIEIENCYIAGFSLFGISLKNCVGHKIHHNYITRCLRDGYGYGILVSNGDLYNFNQGYCVGDKIYMGMGGGMSQSLGGNVEFTKGSNIIKFLSSSGDNAGEYKIGNSIQKLQIGDTICVYNKSNKIAPTGISYYESHVYYKVISATIYDIVEKKLIVQVDKSYPFQSIVRGSGDVYCGLKGYYEVVGKNDQKTFNKSNFRQIPDDDNYSTIIEKNFFSSNRHSIAGGGGISSSYIARYNIFADWHSSHNVDRHGDGGRSIVKNNIHLSNGWKNTAFFGGVDYNPAIECSVEENYLFYSNNEDAYLFAKKNSTTDNLSHNHPSLNFKIRNNYINGKSDLGWEIQNKPTIKISSSEFNIQINHPLEISVSTSDPNQLEIIKYEWVLSDDFKNGVFTETPIFIFSCGENKSVKCYVRAYNSLGFPSDFTGCVINVGEIPKDITKTLISWWDMTTDLKDNHINNINFNVYGNSVIRDGWYHCPEPETLTQYSPYPYLYLDYRNKLTLDPTFGDFSLVLWIKKTSETGKIWSGEWKPIPNGYSYPLAINLADDKGSGGIYLRWKDAPKDQRSGLSVVISDGQSVYYFDVGPIIGYDVPQFIGISILRNKQMDIYVSANDELKKFTKQITLKSFNFDSFNEIKIMNYFTYRAVGSINRLGMFRTYLTDVNISDLYNKGKGLYYADLPLLKLPEDTQTPIKFGWFKRLIEKIKQWFKKF